MNPDNPQSIPDDLADIGEKLTALFAGALPAQMGDKVQNFTTGISEAFRIYGNLRERIGMALMAEDWLAARILALEAQEFLEDTARFFSHSTSVDDFRHNSYVWAKKHCSPEAAASMGVTAGTPDDYE